MIMVHTRFNESEPNPNPHINFITSLPTIDPQDQENARQFLRALAAQVRPIMKAHGFVVNSFEEYEYNSVFSGRNWNHGETVELVLRRPGGAFLPTSWLMSTLCHELAHIKHMNHGPAFQTLWRDLRNEVRQLQDKGYYGDGYWSSGKRLADSATLPGAGVDPGELPEYMCGGAQNRSRPSFKRRKARRHMGNQTAKKRKPGSRIHSRYAFAGEGLSLTDTKNPEKGTGKGKRAASKRAREERTLAAERRLKLSALGNQDTQGAYCIHVDVSLLTGILASTSKTAHSPESDNETDSDIEFVEIDAVCRKNLLTAESGPTLSPSVISWNDYDNDFIFIGSGQTGVFPASEPLDELHDNGSLRCNVKGKQKPADSRPSCSRDLTNSAIARPPPRSARMATSEVQSKTLGLESGEQRRLDAPSSCVPSVVDSVGRARVFQYKKGSPHVDSNQVGPLESLSASAKWSCLVCTLENELNHLACSACGTTRGEVIWDGPMARLGSF
ncbi:hypothetical protein E1B28_011283 [Marasmius oreades]|uniref:WLM-domain-containing protein n=1 Tax=Marasmius oreades TaxID=181124 RepID=A0A9P7RUA2_9AGAR|nr:uncharacterized protein E1B28_011283 [Marasmius oreades]KAG7089617.1 hypothetical protein E1B28_011283 [Marasmius oreades]